jgi:hypothetical protein
MKSFVFIFTFLMVFVLFSLILTIFKKRLCNDPIKTSENIKLFENFANYHLDEAIGGVNASQEILLQDTYLPTGNKEISKNDAYDIWWHYPVFEVGSYAQITNNIKYPNNPDDGTCMPASMCETLYKNKQTLSNHVYALPPVQDNEHAVRVNYYNAST